MRKIKNTIHILIFSLCFIACYELEVPITTQLTPAIFPQTPDQFVSAAGPTYNQLRQDYAIGYWFLQALSTDEAIMPARGGNWFDNGRYEQHHKHTWTPDNAHVNGVWNYLSSTISIANQNMFVIEQGPDAEGKATSLAELRMMRAFATFLMMDLWGNVPIPSGFGDTDPIVGSSRTEVFNYIEDEIMNCIPDLNPAAGIETYGRPNLYTAYALLAKLYLNAEVYTGSPRWDDAIAACDMIISSGEYALEEDYHQMFFPGNGPEVSEFIFAIPFDAAAPNGFMFYCRYWLPRSTRDKYGLNFTPSAPMSTISDFYFKYFDDDRDQRENIWLKGKQYDFNGNPIIVNTTKRGFDEDYQGADATEPLAYHVELTPEIIIKNQGAFYLGNDEKAWNMGYRSIKFYPDNTSATRNQNNDVPIFRYADIILMKAEALLRGGSPTLGHSATSLVNELRVLRTTAETWSSVDLEMLFGERSREFVNENWRRNDMIRFGKFEDSWGYKTDSDPNKRLFPIPTQVLQLNPGLTQNPGYN